MKRNRKNQIASTVFLIAVAFTSQSCRKKPEACISASKETVKVGEEITFTDCSENTQDEFSLKVIQDLSVVGKISADMPYNQAFWQSGTHTLTYTVNGKKDDEDVQTIDITVEAPTKANLIGSWKIVDAKGFDRKDYLNDNFYDFVDINAKWERIYTFDDDTLIISFDDGMQSFSFKEDWYIKNNESVFDHPYVYTDGEDHEYPMFEIHKITNDKLEIVYLEDEWVIYYLEKM